VNNSNGHQIEPDEPDSNAPPWLNRAFLSRLDALNDMSSIGSDDVRPRPVESDMPLSVSLATFAHEMRTPLATLHATLELLGDDRPHDPDDFEQLVSRLQRGVQWITQLVENISVESRHDGAERRQGSPALVLDWVERAIELVQPLADQRRQTILFACPRPSPVVYGDCLQLGQVMVNLLTNACRYGAWSDTITVSVVPDNTNVSIRVSDHGMGILPDEIERIFECRERGTGSHVQCEDGQGLGLHIVKQIVEQHTGTISVESAVGRGSTFTVRLPIMRAPRPLLLRTTIVEEGNTVR
jgi:signal transduction histidine kinase